MSTLGHEVEDFGTHSTESCDYPDIAETSGTCRCRWCSRRGILICGTGITGIAANKLQVYVQRFVTIHFPHMPVANIIMPVNILTMGERVIGPGLAKDIVTIWLITEFEGGRHARVA